MRRKRICVALQGGGAHGAFTWGVLDRLLQEPQLEIEAVSGTSAGAMNGAVLVDGLKRGGANLARERLEALWRSVSAAGSATFRPGRRFVPAFTVPLGWAAFAPWSDALSLVWSPYDNPFYRNLLVDVLRDVLPRMDALNDSAMPYLFVCATNVRTNERKIFRAGELDVAALTASACLPTLFRTVHVGRDAYWDGGYLGNPALLPLRSPALSPDLLLVWVNPLARPDVPTSARAIQDRINEITFNASMVQEIEAIDAINVLKDAAGGGDLPFKRVRLHEIKDDPHMAGLDLASKLDTSWPFLQELRDFGRHAAQRWIHAHLDDVGHTATADVQGVLRCVRGR